VRADSTRILPQFLFEFLNSPLGRYLLVSAEAGGRWHEEKIGFRFAELNLPDLKRIRVPLPSVEHQQAIVERLLRVVEQLTTDLRQVV
jgi:restriction endonuclease S subunit